MTDIKVFKGDQIGGNITMITTDLTKIIIDYGEDLPGSELQEEICIGWEKENVDAVFFTHYHADHIGKFMEIPENVPLYMSESTRRILINIYKRLHIGEPLERLERGKGIHVLEEKKPVRIKDVFITPYHVDHSAFDSYMFFIETPDKNILHTGDYRSHGYRSHKTVNGQDVNSMIFSIQNEIRQNGLRQIDVLLTEGTLVCEDSERSVYTEQEMQNDLTELFKKQKYVFVKVSSTNADSLLSFYQAAEANGMGFYAAEHVLDQLKVFEEMSETSDIHYCFTPAWPILRKNENEDTSEKYKRSFEAQRNHMKKDGFVAIVSEHDEDLFEEFAPLHPILIYSMWEGYIDPDLGGDAYNAELADFCHRHDATRIHTCGHASPAFIAEVIECAAPTETILPMHTSHPECFEKLKISDLYKKMICA